MISTKRKTMDSTSGSSSSSSSAVVPTVPPSSSAPRIQIVVPKGSTTAAAAAVVGSSSWSVTKNSKGINEKKKQHISPTLEQQSQQQSQIMQKKKKKAALKKKKQQQQQSGVSSSSSSKTASATAAITATTASKPKTPPPTDAPQEWPTKSSLSLPPLRTETIQSIKNGQSEYPINEECTSLKIVPSGRHIVAGFTDGTLRMFDLTGTFKPTTNSRSSSSYDDSDSDDNDDDNASATRKTSKKKIIGAVPHTAIQDDFFDTNSSSSEDEFESDDDDNDDDGHGSSPKKRFQPRVGRPSLVSLSSSSPLPGGAGNAAGNGGLVMSKQFQQYGSVVSQIFARGVHTSLLMEVDVSEDGLYAFGGVARGSMELVALDMSRVEQHQDELQQQQNTSTTKNENVTPTTTTKKDMLDLIRVHRHSDAKLKGFGACTRLRSSTKQKYLLLTGRGIKNIHIWSFEPPTTTTTTKKKAAVWQCLYDTQTNGNSINLLHFRYDPNGLLQGISKSDDQKLRVWDLSLEQHEGSTSNPIYHKKPIIQCFESSSTKKKKGGRKPKQPTTATTANTTMIKGGSSSTETPTLERPKRPPFCDVSSTESCLGVCGSFAFCGGGGMYNQMSVVSLDVENVKSPFNHMDLALPKTGMTDSSSSSCLTALAAAGGSSSSSSRGGRRQQRGELKSIVNVAGMVMDAGHVLLELSDGSVVQYCQHQLDAVGLPQLRPVSPSMFQSKLEPSSSSSISPPPPMMMMQKEDISGRQICLGRVGAGGNVVAAMTTYNPSAGRGTIVLRCLDGQHEKQPVHGFWGFHGVSSLPFFATPTTTSPPISLPSSAASQSKKKKKTAPIVSKATINRSKIMVPTATVTASDSPPADKKALAAIACPTPLATDHGHALDMSNQTSSPESATGTALGVQLFHSASSSATEALVTPKPKPTTKKSVMAVAAPIKARNGGKMTKKPIIGNTPTSSVPSSINKRASPIPIMPVPTNATTPAAAAASRVVVETPQDSVASPPRVSIESSPPTMTKNNKTMASSATTNGVTVSPDQKSPMRSFAQEQQTPSPPNKDSGAIEKFLKPTANVTAATKSSKQTIAKSKVSKPVVSSSGSALKSADNKLVQKDRPSTAGKMPADASLNVQKNDKAATKGKGGGAVSTTLTSKVSKSAKAIVDKPQKTKRVSSKDSVESASSSTSSKRKKVQKTNTGATSRKRSASPRSASPRQPSAAQPKHVDTQTNLTEIAAALCEISKTPPKKQRVAPKPRQQQQQQGSKSSIPPSRKQAPSTIYHAFDQPKSLLETTTKSTVEDRLEGMCNVSRNSDDTFLSTSNAPHAAARRRLAAQHRAAHEMLHKKVMNSVDSIIRSLRTEITTAEEARLWLEESITEYREMLDDMLHRQQMEASSLAAQKVLYQPGEQAALLHVSFPFPEVFSQARATLQAFVSPKSNSAK